MIVFVFLGLLCSTLMAYPKRSFAVCFGIPCTFCGPLDCALAAASYLDSTYTMDDLVMVGNNGIPGASDDNIEDHINEEEWWIVRDFFRKFFVRGLAEMTEYLSAFGMYQVEMIGYLLDAKQQIETQRLFWKLHAEAHKDYHPSDDFCWYGTSARSMAASETRGRYNAVALAEWNLNRQLGDDATNAANGVGQDQDGRWREYVQRFCDPKDNNWVTAGTGLDLACDHDGVVGGPVGAIDKERINRDVDYTGLVEVQKTIDMNLSDGTVQSGDRDVLAMAANLYGNHVLSRSLSRDKLRNVDARSLYLALRSVAAKRTVAQNSFNAIVGMRSSGTSDGTSGVDTREFIAAAFKDLMPTGTSDADVYKMIGENPSYYAQLELLGKKIYENPDFFANLYDTPANVERKKAAMKGIALMLDRALYESELRQEMLMSVLLANEMRSNFRTLNKDLQRDK